MPHLPLPGEDLAFYLAEIAAFGVPRGEPLSNCEIAPSTARNVVLTARARNRWPGAAHKDSNAIDRRTLRLADEIDPAHTRPVCFAEIAEYAGLPPYNVRLSRVRLKRRGQWPWPNKSSGPPRGRPQTCRAALRA